MGDSTFLCCAYCWRHEDSWDTILCYRCDKCRKRVHYDCIKSPQPSILLGDTFFSFNCEACSESGKEQFERTSISWIDVVILALYNLHKAGHGMCGFFHWRAHICRFIEKHWLTLFGSNRKRTNLWQGTVAGTLSAGCPQFFESGATTVEQGFWKLITLEPPLPQVERKCQRNNRKPKDTPVEIKSDQLRSRRPKESSLTSAMELKEKRSVMQEGRKKKSKELKNIEPSTSSSSCKLVEDAIEVSSKQEKKKPSKKLTSLASVLPRPVEPPPPADSQDSLSSVSSSSAGLLSSIGEDVECTASHSEVCDVGGVLTAIEYDSDLDIEVDIGSASFMNEVLPDMRPISPDINTMLNLGSDLSQSQFDESPLEPPPTNTEIKMEPVSDCESEGQSEKDIEDRSVREQDTESDYSTDESEDDEDCEGRSVQSADTDTGSLNATQQLREVLKKTGRPRKRRRVDDTPPPSPPPRLERISLFEEGELLQKLDKKAETETLPQHLAVLRRKLICNQTNREYGLPVLDLDRAVRKELNTSTASASQTPATNGQLLSQLPRRVTTTKETRDLDRFTTQGSKKSAGSRQYTSFRQRLVGLEDHELKPFVSPYTTRVLLPFIWRNYKPRRKPMKMRLLEEILAYHHRCEPDWVASPSVPIDFCYVRPEHIPSVNALCREFFWPGIDMSECLQYPDYSCVVMYRKIVIAFAFLVPDRGYNEAYISFVFTHPEWRGAGIATFMVYHLIQTCMGKDVVLHVSATNSAMFLYQRFGFKAEEYILNFYHKYFPLNSKDSNHAFLMRLSR